MQENYSTFNVPSFAREKTYNFDATREYAEIFEELNAISEEIEQCRARNS
jgi:uncharacterized protein YydD (DUF2326 family)